MPAKNCPCGQPSPYDECCAPLHRGGTKASTPEQLMRSRFTAYVVHDEPYLLRTWHPSTRPDAIPFDSTLHWLRLEVLDSSDGGPFGEEGTVEFRAHFIEQGKRGQLHEHSRFVRHDHAWTYIDGTVLP